ncbi:MAG: hypothetical protein KatS3mg092_0578 [Patescibacteria group bacterium]|nr:MAG: hypothetical protein KatS3mg092_0578 [Patescibacteria group bacterium]
MGYKNNKSKVKSQKSKVIIFFGLFLIIIFFLYRNIISSVFLKGQERVNIVFYGADSFYLSLSNTGVNYLLKIPTDTKILVPGGYGWYRNGALGKLVFLEKKPEIIKKAYSGATSSFVDLYFYTTGKVYYQEDEKNLNTPKISSIIFSSSNANFLDRLILFFKILNKNKSDYRVIKINKIFNQENFNKDYQGIFYKKNYRDFMPTVQIFYKKSYSTAYFLSQIIEGEGIKVVDLSQDENLNDNKCKIITKEINLVSKALAFYFNCNLEKGETLVSDIILKLESLEKDWSVK